MTTRLLTTAGGGGAGCSSSSARIMSSFAVAAHAVANSTNRAVTWADSVRPSAGPEVASRISLENHDDDNYDNAYGNDFETNRKYLPFSWWLLHRGSRAIIQVNSSHETASDITCEATVRTDDNAEVS